MQKISPKYKILIADDEPQNIEDLFETLYALNYQVIVANSGKKCYELAQTEAPAAIIMDWEMPNQNGIDTIKQLKTNEKTRKIPIIMATGKMITSENLQTALEAGAYDYVRKPFDHIEITARVKSMILLFEEHQKNIRLEAKIYKKELQRINEVLREKQITLTTTILRLIQNSKMINNLIDNLQKEKKVACYKTIITIISQYKTNTLASNWKEFEVLFEKVHPLFYKKLNKKFPSLTTNERKICAFLKLNMTNKDIEAITFQTQGALKKAKTRLRQKLGISKNTSTISFIQKI